MSVVSNYVRFTLRWTSFIHTVPLSLSKILSFYPKWASSFVFHVYVLLPLGQYSLSFAEPFIPPRLHSNGVTHCSMCALFSASQILSSAWPCSHYVFLTNYFLRTESKVVPYRFNLFFTQTGNLHAYPGFCIFLKKMRNFDSSWFLFLRSSNLVELSCCCL